MTPLPPQAKRPRDPATGRIISKTRYGLRRCARCRETLPVDQFEFRSSSSPYRHSYCRSCRRAAMREIHRRARQDPVRGAVLRQDQRMWAALRRRDAGVPETGARRAADGAYDPIGLGQWMDAAPIAGWLQREFGTWPTAELAAYLDADEAGLRRLISGEHRRISLVMADRIFTAAGCTHLLELLYPMEAA